MDILDILLDILLKPPQPFIGLFFDITSSGGVLIIFCCAISDFDIEQIDIWSKIVSRVSMLGESRSW